MTVPTIPADLHILQHALGLDAYGQGTSYRNHFVTGDGSTDHPICMDLVQQGLMVRRDGNELSGGDDVFYVTQPGKAFVKAHSPKPVALSRSKQRYERYLAEDGMRTFGAFLKGISE